MIEQMSILQGARILLLEDDALISIDTEDMLLSLGVAHILIAHTIEEAAALFAGEEIDAAVLDLVIGHHRCEDFARELVERGTPVVFASGFGDRSSLPELLRRVPTVEKPYSAEALHTALTAAMRAR